MGNMASFGGPPKCPRPFASTDAFACVMQCPLDKKFIRKGSGTSYACVYTPDETFKVDLVTVGAVQFIGTTLEELKEKHPDKYTEFTAEQDRFEREIAVVYGNIDEAKKIEDAFRDLQKAENTRDQSPEAYQVARTAYYTLLKGDRWIDTERKRIAKAVVEPEVVRYSNTLASIRNQRKQQEKTIDIVRGVKDKVLSVKDDFKYSVDILYDQLEKLKIQINMKNRSRVKPEDSTLSWIDILVNVLLLASLVYVAWFLYKKYTTPLPPVYRVQI